MKAENKAYLESCRGFYEKMLSTIGLETIIQTGLLSRFDLARIQSIMNEEFRPGYSADVSNLHVAYQMILDVYTHYLRTEDV